MTFWDFTVGLFLAAAIICVLVADWRINALERRLDELERGRASQEKSR